jgi:diguanylate cyclase (GGDEF) domain
MIKGLITNIAILIAFISIRFLILNYQPEHRATLWARLVSGVYYGSLGIILMFFKINDVPNNLAIDFSNIGVILAAIYDGIPAAAVTFLIISFSHLLLFGVSTSSIIIIGVGALMIISGSLISLLYQYSHVKKRMFTTLSGIFIICSFYPLFIKNAAIRWEILIYLWLGSIPGAVLIYYYIKHLQTLNEHFQKLKQESSTDFLTNVNNVRSFERLFSYAIHSALEMEESLSLLYIDIDYFKKINDTFGHINGDIVLKEFARVLMRNCRSFGTISRNGGEEFSIILLDYASAQAYSIAERIRASVEAHEFKLPDGKTARITISIGVATFPEPVRDPNKLQAKADEALYIAKCNGRNKVALAKNES